MATAVVSRDGAPWRLNLPQQLPGLKGKWLTAYSALWALALLIAIAAPIRGTMLNYSGLLHPVWRPHGVVTERTDSALTVRAVFGDEARRAGVRAGDRIIAVDGWRIREQSADNHLHALLDGPEGSTDRLRLRSPSGQEREVTLATRASTATQMFRGTGVSLAMFDATALFLALAFPLFLVPAAVILFARRRREIIPALLSISFLVITIFVSAQIAVTDAGISDAVAGTILVLFGWMPLVLALVTFPDGRFVPKWTAAVLLLFPICVFNDLWWLVDWSDQLAIGVAFIVAGIALAVRYRRFEAGPQRQQLRWAFFGFFVGISLLMVIIPLLMVRNELLAVDLRWAVWLPIIFNVCGGLSIPCMALGLLVSVFKYRLYDADSVIGRSAAYGVLTIGFIALFAGSENLAGIIGERYFEHSIGIIAGAIGAAVAAAVVVPLHNRVHRWAERRFQKTLMRLRDGLPECVGDLRESASVDDLVRAVMVRVEAGVRSTRQAMLLRERGRWSIAGAYHVAPKQVRAWLRGWSAADGKRTLDRDGADVLFPLRVRLCIDSGGETETIGWLLLGPRPDGSFFGKDERDALEAIAGAVARAVHIAQLREHREAQAEKRLCALEALVEKVAAAVAREPAVSPAIAAGSFRSSLA